MNVTPFAGTVLKSLHIGVGGRGQWPISLATPERGYSPVTICDPNSAALDAARAKTGLPESASYTDLERALEETKADCAIICAPTHLHVPLVKRCVKAGLKSILVEKGMATSWEEACELVEFTALHEAKVAIAQNYRYRTACRTIRRLVDDSSDGISHPSLVVYHEPRARPQPRNLTYPHASIWDMSCHHFDTLISWLGPVESISAQAWGAPWSAYEHPNNTSAHILFRSGARVHYLHGHDASRSSLRVELHGEKGAIVWTGTSLTVNERPTINFTPSPESELPLDTDSGEAGVLEDFHRYVTEGIEPGISARNNLEVMALCQMMVMAIEQGSTVLRSDLNGVAA